jgi:hypothetical protein
LVLTYLGTAYATISDGSPFAVVANTTYCRPLCRYVIGTPVCVPLGTSSRAMRAPVRLFSTQRLPLPLVPSPAKSNVRVTSNPARDALPVLGMLAAGSFRRSATYAGVSPFGTIHA